jgi:hypothetical protein
MREVRGSNPDQVIFDFYELKLIIGNQWSHLSGIEPEYSRMVSEHSNYWTTNCRLNSTSTSSYSAHTHVSYAARRERRDASLLRLSISDLTLAIAMLTVLIGSR